MDYYILYREDKLFQWNEVEEDFISLEEAMETLKHYQDRYPDRLYKLFIKLS